jgi:hypothetical protein
MSLLLVATAWASLVSLGEEGYLKAAGNIQETFEVLVNGYAPRQDRTRHSTRPNT